MTCVLNGAQMPIGCLMSRMTEQQKRTFITEDLYYELRCLLGATTLWKAFKAQDRGFDVVIAMDAAFVHTRCLYKFFTQQQSSHDISITEFGAVAYSSMLFRAWEEALNRHVLHISKGRLNPTNTDSTTHLNEHVESFAKDIYKLWLKFENDPLASTFATELLDARTRAAQDADNDASKHGISPVFT
jgi:hypothetical protein